jgi:LmbE family N-acetylglucosaminyl deacetylase
VPTSRTLVAIIAHPDDESYSASGTLAYYASIGVDVYIICATRGEAGKINHPSLAYRDVLGAVREEELRNACRIMGIHQPLFLGYRDSGMMGSSDNNDPLSLNKAKPSEVLRRLVGLLRQLKPQVIISYYEGGYYAHPDHISSHRYTLEAFNAVSNPTVFPEQLKGPTGVFNPQRLFTVAIPTSRIEELIKAIPEDKDEPITYIGEREDITVRMNVSDLYEIKRNAIAAHKTQHQGEGVFSNIPEALLREFFSTEHFSQEAPQTSEPQIYGDLFEGI